MGAHIDVRLRCTNPSRSMERHEPDVYKRGERKEVGHSSQTDEGRATSMLETEHDELVVSKKSLA